MWATAGKPSSLTSLSWHRSSRTRRDGRSFCREKESTSNRPDNDALFDRLGDALIINISESGVIFGVQVCHQGLEKVGFSSSGKVKAEPFSIENGVLKARVSSGGEQEFFGDRWNVDLEIEVTLPNR